MTPTTDAQSRYLTARLAAVPQPKPWYKSRVLLVNLLSVLVVAIGGVLDARGVLMLTAQQVEWFSIGVAVANATIRILMTNQPLSVGKSVPSLR